MNERIRQHNFSIDILETEKQQLKTRLQASLPSDEFQEVVRFTQNASQVENDRVKSRHIEKYRKLKERKQTVSEQESTDNRTSDSGSDNKSKWVVNLSSRKLNDHEINVLNKGLNYGVSPRALPVEDFIVATEVACDKLDSASKQELRAKVTSILKNAKPPANNINAKDRRAISDLKKDDDIIILPADKGKITVVLDSESYESKVNDLLSDEKTYSKLKKDPTNSYKNKLLKVLKELKEKGAIDQSLYEKLRPSACVVPCIYGLPKVHKQAIPVRPIVSSIGSVCYNLARFISDILSPLVGKSPHHIQNSQDFVNKIKDLVVNDNELITSYDVSALFTSVPVDRALQVVDNLLKTDNSWKARTYLSDSQIITLLEFCLTTTYFKFRGQLYQQDHGCAMGLPVSPIIANLYMEFFELEAIKSATHPPRVWMRYVDDTFVVINKSNSQQFTDHINSIDPHIKFTQDPEKDRTLPFLDTLVTRLDDGSLKVSVYRKPTHTDQYLAFDSHHPLEHKLSVIRTLFHRADTVVTNSADKDHEINHVKSALKRCGYTDWSFKRACATKEHKTVQSNASQTADNSTRKTFVVAPYVEGVSERLQRVFKSYGVSVCHKPHQTLRKLLVAPKDKTKVEEQSGVVYRIPCSSCNKVYVGETKRVLGERLKEHTAKTAYNLSAIAEHCQKTGHEPDLENVSVLCREDKFLPRKIREAIYIKKETSPTLNRDGGRELSSIYDSLLEIPSSRTPSTARFRGGSVGTQS